MKNEIKTFRLFVRPDNDSQRIANKIRELNSQKSTPLVEADDADLVIAIGGDGTFIDAVTQTQFSKKILYTGIHTGTLGFLQDLCPNDVYTLVQYIDYEKELKTRKVYVASVKVFLKNSSYHEFFALNEVHVAGKDYKKIAFSEYVNGELLQNISGIGIIIATSTGETAYSLNAGGAINLSDNSHLVCTVEAAMKNSVNEPFIANSVICSNITLVLNPSENIGIFIDGQKKDIDSISVERIEVSITKDSNYINKLDIMNFSKVSTIRDKILGCKSF